jgi:rhodanese-related sulfurtransferase
MRHLGSILSLVLGLSLFLLFTQGGYAASVQKITKEELKAVLDDPAVAIIDVRSEGDWKGSDQKIKGAVREDPDETKKWAIKYAKEKKMVLYCS